MTARDFADELSALITAHGQRLDAAQKTADLTQLEAEEMVAKMAGNLLAQAASLTMILGYWLRSFRRSEVGTARGIFLRTCSPSLRGGTVLTCA